MTERPSQHPDQHPVVVHSTQPDPARLTEETIQQAQRLIHEVANLVDGSIRLIDLARRSIQSPAGANTDPTPAIRHLDGAHAALSHIAALVRSAYRPSTRDRASGILEDNRNAPPSLASAIISAVDVLAHRLRSLNITVHLDLDATSRGVPADEIYAVVSNAVRNSIEAIGRDGRIDIRARVHEGAVTLEILDDGPGPPRDADRVFELGFSTRSGSAGIGLALAAEVVTELRGTIRLLPRNLDNRDRPGAILRATYPIPSHASASFQG
ncbi:MAG: hypothetical protein JNK58_07415 [Phycisphaerae bacterium]|nr:hypothetical protein [Phycisphaerae bacterium]